MDASDDYVKVLGDPHCLRIISACYLRANTVQNISRTHDIPIAVCYRKVGRLKKMGLLHQTDYAISGRGKRVYRYKAVLDNTSIYFSNGKVYVTMRFKNGDSRRFSIPE